MDKGIKLDSFTLETNELNIDSSLIGGVMDRKEYLISFLRQYQKACEVMHVGKINAKDFVENYINETTKNK